MDDLKRSRKFYYLSLFCLVPIIGVIVGIILVYRSLFMFKSYKLLLVALIALSGGIILSIIVPNYLRNDLKYGYETGKLFAILDADYLDSISVKLEDYKKKNGVYPENLIELKNKYPYLEIIDPLLGRNPKAHKQLNFYYQPAGETYILFSSGIDGIPGTKDDIYPRKPLK